MESSKIKAVFIIALAAMFAVYLGVSAATAQFKAIAWVAGGVGIAFILALGRNVWMLIPIGLVLQGTVNALPGSPPVWAAGTAVTMMMFMLRFALRKPDFVWRFDWLDMAVLLQLLAVAQAYMRNPTGLLILGGSTAGGKAYFLFVVAICAYFCISVVRPNLKNFKIVVIAMIAVIIGDGLLATASDYIPFVAKAILPIYSNANFAVAMAGDSNVDLSSARGGGGFSLLGKALVLPCLCMARPVQCLFPTRPVLFTACAVGSILVLLSGFRSGIGYLLIVFIVSALLRRKYLDVMVVGIIGILGLSVLLMSGSVKSLPFGAQRVLSVLPIEVSAAARADAENSSEWRFEMWRLALGTDRYIQNKLLGDGFALSAREMRHIQDVAFGLTDQSLDSQEQMLSLGAYHSFPVETIRFTGVVGLACALFLMIVAFRKSLVLVRHYRGSPIFPYVMYVCVPMVIYLFWSQLVFGAYRVEFPQIIALTGLLKMLDNQRVQELAAAAEPVPLAGNPPAAAPAPRQRPVFGGSRA